jgi:type IV secretory pathway protease TraF
MELRAAYGVLEVAVGASEEVVRDARKTLMKVWHPDRHANDPALEKRAQIKVAEVNTAFEAIRAAGFPPPGPEPAPKAITAAPVPPVSTGTIELVPRRRVRWSVIVLLLAVVGAGAYLAVIKRGSAPVARDAAAREVHADAAIPIDVLVPADAETIVVEIDAAAVVASDAGSTYVPPQTAVTFGLGATHEQVVAAQGKATQVEGEHWSYGGSTVTFNKRGRVVGWWDHDDVLNVKLEPGDPAVAAQAKAAGSYGMGASKDEVIGVQGTPNRIDATGDETWYYGKASSVVFNGTGRITGYHNVNGELALQ